MLKIKKQLPLASIDETEYNKNQEDIKSSIILAIKVRKKL